ncbi:MAG: hypothetical protein ACOC9X_01110, partial [bacterium]
DRQNAQIRIEENDVGVQAGGNVVRRAGGGRVVRLDEGQGDGTLGQRRTARLGPGRGVAGAY